MRPSALASTRTRDHLEGSANRPPATFFSGFGQCGASQERGEHGWVPSRLVTEGWLCPVAAGRESCLVAHLRRRPCTVVLQAPHQPGVARYLPGSSAPLTSPELGCGQAFMRDESGSPSPLRGGASIRGVPQSAGGLGAGIVHTAQPTCPSPMDRGPRGSASQGPLPRPDSRIQVCREDGAGRWALRSRGPPSTRGWGLPGEDTN